MTRETFTIAATNFLCIAAATSSPVTFESPSECRDSAKKLTLNQTPVIIVIGKAYFDVGHSLKDQTAEAIFPATQLGRFIR